MNKAVRDIVEQYKRLPASARRDVMDKLRDVDNEWNAEFDELDKLLPDVDLSMADIQQEINAYRLEQAQTPRQNVPDHS